ncbi:MAG: hypothetical protein LUE99_06905 [Bacteroides sp.]|nr:hypothetical protein [Bacteroides sp.]
MTKSIQPSQGWYKGFIPLSREAYQKLHRKYCKQPATETEAYCILMANVNYRESSLTFGGKPIVCPVGDSFKSLDTWKRLFRWSKTRVRRFFLSLQVLGLIEYSTEMSLAHVHVVDYIPPSVRQQEERDRQFELFWDSYHEITQLPKRSIGKAKREWCKLPADEKKLAIRQIPFYYEGLNNTKYCKQAAGYLADKRFLDE